MEMEFPDDHLAVSGVQALLFFQVELRVSEYA